ncbi:MAG: hypothetical protein GF364_16695 [Candidatus Lokiarchaeota archaeon]|nr:hypothetical protein [Candidatus Lokiarchaeota archaeon]
MDSEKGKAQDYRSVYTFIFTFFYLFEGIHQGMVYVYPFLLMKFQEGAYDAAMIMYISSATSLPWAFKFIVGAINDKWGSKRLGRRFPFILGGGGFCAIFWVVFALKLPELSYNTPQVYGQLLFYSIMTNIGMAIADTAIDGLILDITTKDKLGKVQSITWGFLLIGSTFGGAGLGFVFLQFDLLALFFMLTGIFCFIGSVLTIFVKERVSDSIVLIKGDIRKLFVKKENWKVYSFTLTESATNPMISLIFPIAVLVSIGSLNSEETLLILASGNIGSLFIDTVVIQIGYGIGVTIGILIAYRITDRSRSRSVRLGYYFYIPMCFIAIFFKGLILGNIAMGFFGLSYGLISVSGQTVRGDIAKQHFKDAKSTFFAILISISNAGLALGNFLIGLIFQFLALRVANFDLLMFLVMCFCALILIISLVSFNSINPDYYEFKKNLENIEVIDVNLKENED